MPYKQPLWMQQRSAGMPDGLSHHAGARAADDETPLVSIGIPTHNRGDRYLPVTLHSALSQTYGNLEIVVSDNGSTDGTADGLAAIRDPRLRWYRHEEAMSPNDNFNFCLGQAKGRWFLLLHDDDVIDPDFVTTCIGALQGRRPGLIRTGTRIIDADGNTLLARPNRASTGSDLDDLANAWIRNDTGLFLCSTLFATDSLRLIGGFGSRHHLLQDVLVELDLAARFGHVEVSDVKASFRRHPGEMTKATKVRLWQEDAEFLLDRLGAQLAPADKPLLRDMERFMADLVFRRALEVQGGLARLSALASVIHRSGYRNWPPARMLAPRRLRSALGL